MPLSKPRYVRWDGEESVRKFLNRPKEVRMAEEGLRRHCGAGLDLINGDVCVGQNADTSAI